MASDISINRRRPNVQHDSARFILDQEICDRSFHVYTIPHGGQYAKVIFKKEELFSACKVLREKELRRAVGGPRKSLGRSALGFNFDEFY